MAALSSVSVANVSFSISNPQILRSYRRLPTLFASASATPSHESSSSTQSGSILSSNSPPKVPFVESPKTPENGFNYALANPNGNPVVRFVQHTESTIERAIFDFRFLAFLAIGGSLAGSLLCFLNGCVYIIDAYRVYWTSCVKGIHTGQMVLRLVEAIDVYLAGTVMFIFGMGLYGLFITNFSANVDPTSDRALKHSSLFGMFALKVVALWIFFTYITIFLFANLNWPYTSTVPLYIVAFFINFSLFFLFDYLRKEIGDGKSDGYLSKGRLLCLEESCLSWNCLHVA